MENTNVQEVKMPITYDDLKKSLVDSGRPYDFAMIDRAYALAEKAHGEQRRRSGEPYICHPLSVAQILVELVKMANLVIMITKSFASAARVEETLAVQPDHPALTGGSSVGMDESGVHFEDAALRYSGAGEDSLSHISFSAALGETVGVIGGTGSGKTSLMHLIPGFYLPTEGQVYVNGTATAA